MTVCLIKHDSKIIGVAEDNAQGLGVLAWFHHNVRAYSMDHATRWEGYSVETVEEIDCHDVESILNAICERGGVKMETTFVPFSKSRHAKPAREGAAPWRSLNWQVVIKGRSRATVETTYAQGEGFAPASKASADKIERAARLLGVSAQVAKRRMIDSELETGRQASRYGAGRFNGDAIAPPSIGDVMQSLAKDSDVLDSADFETWASEYGYDTDSRAAEATYRECLDLATKLRACLGVSLLDEIRLAAQFN